MIHHYHQQPRELALGYALGTLVHIYKFVIYVLKLMKRMRMVNFTSCKVILRLVSNASCAAVVLC